MPQGSYLSPLIFNLYVLHELISPTKKTPSLILPQSATLAYIYVNFCITCYECTQYNLSTVRLIYAQTYFKQLRILHTSWGACPQILILFYKILLNSKLEYGNRFYDNASKTSISLLDRLQYQCLQLCLEALVSTPIATLSAEGKVPPLVICRHRYALKLVSLEKNTFRVLGLFCFQNTSLAFRRSRLRSFQNHIFQSPHILKMTFEPYFPRLSFLQILFELYPLIFNINSIFQRFH